MENASLMGIAHGECQLLNDDSGALRLKRALADELVQALPLDILHREERRAGMFAHVVDGDDVRVLEMSSGAGFDKKSSDLRFFRKLPHLDHLQGHNPLQPPLPGFEHQAHATVPNLAQDVVLSHSVEWQTGCRGTARGETGSRCTRGNLAGHRGIDIGRWSLLPGLLRGWCLSDGLLCAGGRRRVTWYRPRRKRGELVRCVGFLGFVTPVRHDQSPGKALAISEVCSPTRYHTRMN